MGNATDRELDAWLEQHGYRHARGGGSSHAHATRKSGEPKFKVGDIVRRTAAAMRSMGVVSGPINGMVVGYAGRWPLIRWSDMDESEEPMAQAEEGLELDKRAMAKRGGRGHATRREGDRLFIGTYPTGIVYADKQRERHGDYLRLAFLPYRTLELEWEKGVPIPLALRHDITKHAERMRARRGEDYPISSSGQTVKLGHARKIESPVTGREVFAAHERDGHITTRGRRALSADEFALPPSPEEKRRGIKGRLPIDTIERARNALARASMMHHQRHLTAAQLAEVRRKVHQKWPSIEVERGHTAHAARTITKKFPDGWYYRRGSGPAYPWKGPFETKHVAEQMRERATGGAWGYPRDDAWNDSHATIKGSWVKSHKPSGATVLERHVDGCRLVVVPVDWTKPQGPANWSITCGQHAHQRGQAATVEGAKSAALRAVKAVHQNSAKDVPSDKLAYAQERANATGNAYAISNMGHVMLADTRNKSLMREELGGIARIVKPSRSSHATKRAVPGISKWAMTAGGTSAAAGKHGYTLTVPEGTYHVWPYTTKLGRHAGYVLKFAATGGRPRGAGGGLWHDLGSHASPQKAAKAAADHYARGFE